MAPSYSRQLLVWSFPTIAVLLSYLWYKKKRIGAESDPGDTDVAEEQPQSADIVHKEERHKVQLEPFTPEKTIPYARSLSGVESSPPIDIIVPRELRSKSKSQPIVISDEDLDLEIEKIRSMNNGIALKISPPFISNTSPTAVEESAEFASLPATPIQETIVIKHNTPVVASAVLEKPKVEKTTPLKSGKRKIKKMAQKDVIAVEDKLTSLQITTNNNNKEKPAKPTTKRERTTSQRRSSERDSANTSPADVMLASPSMSSISDNHSEKSSDSGKGGSDVATPPPTRTLDETIINQRLIYEFSIPQQLVGKLIGRHGSFVALIREKTGAHIVARKHHTDKKVKIVSLEGTQAEIDKALKLIRDKFPVKRYAELTLEQIQFTHPLSTVPLTPDHLYLKLIEGINNDTVLSCMVAPNHLFLQQPTHPTYPNLNVLNSFMNMVYGEAGSPLLPSPVPENTVCAAYSVDAWYRAITITTDAESETTYVKFLDYGGFAYVENCNLRQIRGDFLLLPFQAAECILANIRPVGGDNAIWSEAAYELIAEVTKGALLYTQILDYTEDCGIPLVFCYIVSSPNNPIYLNQLLVDQGFAEWMPGTVEEQPPAEEVVLAPFEGAAGITA